MRLTQPLGAFPYPAGLLLIPEDGSAQTRAVAAALARGRRPESWPAELEAHRLAHLGELQAALDAIDPAGEYAQFNRFVLGDETVDPERVAEPLGPALGQLVDVIRFSSGDLDTAPGLSEATDPVVGALVLATQATEALAGENAQRAVDLLRQAATLAEPGAPALAALMLGNAGTLTHTHLGRRDAARCDLEAALAGLADTDLNVSRAEFQYQLGGMEHELAAAGQAALRPAMDRYFTALQLITCEEAPYLWACTQLNLATAYLASPMVEATDALRMGIAIQALRAALEVFTADEHPEQWATTTLNLANALVYTPSVKQGDNVVEAVELYEQVLAVRDRSRDPLGRARVLANQGNALAHLGIFDQAKAKLVEARFLFEEHLDHDAALGVRSVLDEIVKSSTMQRTG